jgi:hypothetical protein
MSHIRMLGATPALRLEVERWRAPHLQAGLAQEGRRRPASSIESELALESALELTIGTERAPLPLGVRWTARHLQPNYLPIQAWLDVDLLLMQLSELDFPYLIVEATHSARFAQAMGESDAMIVEVSCEIGMHHPPVWRLRRTVALPHAELATHAWDGDGIDPLNLFSAEEAGIAFRAWLRNGVLPTGVAVEEVVY